MNKSTWGHGYPSECSSEKSNERRKGIAGKGNRGGQRPTMDDRIATVVSGEFQGATVCILVEFDDGRCVVDRGEGERGDNRLALLRIEDLRPWTKKKWVSCVDDVATWKPPRADPAGRHPQERPTPLAKGTSSSLIQRMEEHVAKLTPDERATPMAKLFIKRLTEMKANLRGEATKAKDGNWLDDLLELQFVAPKAALASLLQARRRMA